MSQSVTFRTSPGSYAALCGVLSIPLVVLTAVYLGRGVADPALLAIAVLLPSTAAVWLAYLRLRLDDSGLEYRDLFGRTLRIPYSQISGLRSEWLFGRYPQWMLHLRDGRKLRINFKAFPRSAYAELSKRIHKPA
jgi:hypothetical protein